MEGQYIQKNLMLISAATVIGDTTRGGRFTARPACCACKGVCTCKAGR